MSEFSFQPKDFETEPASLPMMSLREVVMFPRSIVPLFVGREASIKAIEGAIADFDKKIFLVTQKTPEKERPGPQDLFAVGTVSRILQMLRLPDGTIKVLFEGLYRARWAEQEIEPAERIFPIVRVERLAESAARSPEGKALVRGVQEALEDFGKVSKKLAPEALLAITAIKEPGPLADAVMPHLKVDFARKQAVLEELDPLKRLELVYEHLLGEIEIISIEKRVKGRVKSQMEKNQREYYINEQVKALNKELGREDDPQAEAAELERQLEAKKMPDEAKERVKKEIKKLKQMPQSSAEYTVVRNYVDWVLDLPWGELKPCKIDIAAARIILDEDHYGLEKPKERILEYLAVQSLVTASKGPIL